ncbi:hypothetical protein LJB42_001556 [Komagataella kurtzmanii]|nr:hypothetical protein LJB42_001556 [Komagataella kurtzmanii]
MKSKLGILLTVVVTKICNYAAGLPTYIQTEVENFESFEERHADLSALYTAGRFARDLLSFGGIDPKAKLNYVLESSEQINDDLYYQLATQYIPLLQVAYCDNEQGALRTHENSEFLLPPKLRLPFQCNETLENSQRRFRLLKVFRIPPHKMISKGGGNGYILLDHKLKKINVFFRGSRFANDWLTNLDYVEKPYRPNVWNSSVVSETIKNYDGVSENLIQKYISRAVEVDSFTCNEWRNETTERVPTIKYYQEIATLLHDSNRAEINSAFERKTGGELCFNCEIHSGFNSVMKVVLPEILPLVFQSIERFPEYQLVLGGHSQGGAFAQILQLELSLLQIKSFALTASASRVFSHELAYLYDLMTKVNEIEEHLIEGQFPTEGHVRIVHHGDIIPSIPFRNVFSHTGYEVYLANVYIPHSTGDFYLSGMREYLDILQDLDSSGIVESFRFSRGWVSFDYYLRKLGKLLKIKPTLKAIKDYVMNEKIGAYSHRNIIDNISACNALRL